MAAQDALDYHLKIVSTGTAKAVALYVSLSDSPLITQSIYKKLYDKVGLKNQFFDDIDSAKSWLTSQLS